MAVMAVVAEATAAPTLIHNILDGHYNYVSASYARQSYRGLTMSQHARQNLAIAAAVVALLFMMRACGGGGGGSGSGCIFLSAHLGCV